MSAPPPPAQGPPQPQASYTFAPRDNSGYSRFKDVCAGLVMAVFVCGVACVVGLTWKPTKAVEGKIYGTISSAGVVDDDTKDKLKADDNDAMVCKQCSLDPVKLYSMSFGWSLASALIIILVGFLYLNAKEKKQYELGAKFNRAMTGTDTITGSLAQGMLEREQIRGPQYGQVTGEQAQQFRSQLVGATQQDAMQNQWYANTNVQYPPPRPTGGGGAAAQRWLAGRLPRKGG